MSVSLTDQNELTPVWPLPPPGHLRSTALRPLLFPEPVQDCRHLLRRSQDLPLPCVMCERCFGESGDELKSEKWEGVRDQLLQHLLSEHSIVIHQVDHIASLRSYCQYWRAKMTADNIAAFCPVIRTNTDQHDPAPSQDYYLMSDALPEDLQLRQSLQLARLEAVLNHQQSERVDTEFKRSCLFCGLVVIGNRAAIFHHMLQEHGFTVGQPDNLVFVDEFLDLLHQKLDSLQCLYCEKQFKDRSTLKEHMRKKQHKKINPNNTDYDRFYVINYLEPGRGWRELMTQEDDETQGDEGWEEWNADCQPPLHCLFCSSGKATSSLTSLTSLTSHMKDAHGFDWDKTVGCHDYYLQVKAVNYLRRQVARQHCPVCQTDCSSEADLMLHMEVKGHCTLPSDPTIWNQAQYLFPTFENDSLLCCLGNSDTD